ncbi:class A beta-lactamase, subclass A2 [Dyadobacter sp. 32]|uniref:class A beta-lactamase, subclass A2 n=1 Tax=Dyadobacter sp. 32 TaxID=538966 RepID=UPI0011EF0E3B
MLKAFRLSVALLLLLSCKVSAQNTEPLRKHIQEIVASKNATVGVCLVSDDGDDTLSIHGSRRFPLQSVFKYHIALAMLSQIDQGKFSLDQKVTIEKADLIPDLYSPIRDKYPNGAALKMSEILDYTVSQSDNVGCDLLLKLLGGPQVVEKYIKGNAINDVSIVINEQTQQSNWDLQFQNWTTPKASVAVLQKFFINKQALLSPKSYDFLWQVMKGTQTGKARLRGKLPEKTIVAHKTGSSGTNKEGLTAAVNDMGIVFLPNGRHFYISVFVTDSKENAGANEKIIADVAKAAWEYFIKELD